MIISQKFENLTLEWEKSNPESVLIDAYDVTYYIDVSLLIEYIEEIKKQRNNL